MKALCAEHPNPDLWFQTDSFVWDRRGALLKDEREKLYSDCAEAIRICERCPVKDECLEIGLKGKRSEQFYGIFGGKMPGERLIMLNAPAKNNTTINAISFANTVRERMEKGLI